VELDQEGAVPLSNNVLILADVVPILRSIEVALPDVLLRVLLMLVAPNVVARLVQFTTILRSEIEAVLNAMGAKHHTLAEVDNADAVF
jgi:hypothetical protein